jgi:hypothetical protein
MLPIVVLLNVLPLTPSGKVDRKALPAVHELAEQGGNGQPSVVEFRLSPLEELVRRIWTEVLGVGLVGLHDNFFELGGHSLLLPQVSAAVADSCGVEVSIVDMFRYPTVHLLAKYVADCMAKARTDSDAVRRAVARGEQQLEARRRLSAHKSPRDSLA